MTKIQISLFVDVEVEEEFAHSYEALKEGYEIITSALEKDNRIGDAYWVGIPKIYKEETK